MSSERIYLSSPHLTGEEQKYVKKAFDTNWVAPLGENVDKFEEEMSRYTGAMGSLALSSGTSSLHLALILSEVKPGDIVFCSSFTFIASANPILYLGAEPVFIDSEPHTWNMSPKALERALKDAKEKNKLPKAVIVVNLYGQSASMEELSILCEHYGVPLIEDAAESLGASYKGKKSGTFGKFGVFSFNGNKIITTSGGGMLVSDDIELLEKGRFLSTQAREKELHYEHRYVGYNYRMSNICAGIGRGQLEVLDERVNARKKINSIYKEALKEIEGILFMPEPDEYFSTNWLTAISFNRKQFNITPHEIVSLMNNYNIECRPVWKPMHAQPVFKGKKYYSHESNRSISDDLFSQGLCLPSGSNMTNDQLNYTIEKLINIFRGNK